MNSFEDTKTRIPASSYDKVKFTAGLLALLWLTISYVIDIVVCMYRLIE